MTFSPKYFLVGTTTKTVFVVKEKRKNADILMIDSSIKLVVRTIPLEAVKQMCDVDFGAAQERKMKATLRRLSKKKGTTKKAKAAVKEVLS